MGPFDFEGPSNFDTPLDIEGPLDIEWPLHTEGSLAVVSCGGGVLSTLRRRTFSISFSSRLATVSKVSLNCVCVCVWRCDTYVRHNHTIFTCIVVCII